MGQLVACMISRTDLLQQAFEAEHDNLGAPDRSADGWGVGFYSDGEVLHRKRPQSPPPDRWAQMVEGVRSHIAIAHTRRATVGEARADNTHPFRMRQWLFAHDGSIGGFDAVRERLLESTPDFLRRNLRGDTDSEHLFHVVLSFLHDSGNLDQVETDDDAVVSALRSTVRLVDRLVREVGAPEPQLDVALTDGRHLYMLARGAPVYLAERDHLPQGRRDSEPSRASVDPVRYVLLTTSTVDPVPADYRPLDPASVTVIDRDLQPRSYPL